jgi:hypothetical protein
MDNQFNVLKYAFIESRLSNIPPEETDLKISRDEAAYLKESGKRKVTCCCTDTRKLLEKLYDFQGLITELDFNIFTKSLIGHPFNHFDSKENLLEGLTKIKEYADYINHFDMKAYFLECMKGEVAEAVKYMGRGRMGDPTAAPYFEQKWKELFIIPNVDPSVSKPQNSEPMAFKPIFNPNATPQIFDILKDFFALDEQPQLKTLLKSGGNVQQALLFLDNGSRLADTFKQLIDVDIITGCNKKELENWISQNFRYKYRNEAKAFTLKYLNEIISTNKDKCKKPIINVKTDRLLGDVSIIKQ